MNEEPLNLKKMDLAISIDDGMVLKELRPVDVSQKYVEWLNDYDITKYTEQKYQQHCIESTKNFVREKYSSSNEILFGIFINQNHVGNVKLGPISWPHLVSEISFFIGDKNQWGKGIASKSINTVVNYGFEKLNLFKFNASYYQHNHASAKVLEKCGFKIDCVRENQLLFEGKRVDMVLVSKAKQD